jgi:hypothetical protein
MRPYDLAQDDEKKPGGQPGRERVTSLFIVNGVRSVVMS